MLEFLYRKLLVQSNVDSDVVMFPAIYWNNLESSAVCPEICWTLLVPLLCGRSSVKPELTSMDHGGILSRSKLICCNIQTCWMGICGQGAVFVFVLQLKMAYISGWFIHFSISSMVICLMWLFTRGHQSHELLRPVGVVAPKKPPRKSIARACTLHVTAEKGRPSPSGKCGGGSWPRRHGTISIVCLILCVVLWDIIYGIYT